MTVTNDARILVVDDLAANRDLLARRLSRDGYEVVTAEDGEAALALIDEDSFDLVLLDVMMPGLSGVEVVTRIRSTFDPAALPVIMVSAVDATDGVVDALERGASDYVTKPFSFPILRARVRSQLRLKRLHDVRQEFVQIASHDLKNPLTRVLGAIGLAAETPSDNQEELADLLDIGLRGCIEMRGIIRDFLDFQALSDGAVQLRHQPIDVGALLQEVIDSVQPAASRKAIVVVNGTPAGELVARADGDRLRQVLANLVGNAVKFSLAGTEARVRAVQSDGELTVEVIDQGPGFTEEDLRRAFTRYARLSNRPTGGETSTGLGLAISRQIIGLHGGDIGVRNNLDGPGATVWFRIPEGA